MLAPRATREEIAAWILLGAVILLVIWRDLTAALVAGLVFYLLLDTAAGTLARWISGRALRPVAVLVGTVVGGTAVTGAIALLIAIVRAQVENIPALLGRMAEILQSTQIWLDELGGAVLAPETIRDAEDLKQIVVTWLQEHSGSIGRLGEGFSIALIHIVMALLLAAMVFLRHARSMVDDPGTASRRPLARYLKQKVGRFTAAFAQVVSAQVKISAINTTLTAIYLLAILPPFIDRRLPFTVTMIFITFVAGLIPVVGNLISNTVIVVVSLGAGLWVAVASLLFLVLIHKGEYVINSKIVGAKTGSQIWEILLAILIGEAAFGLQGIILGPVIYTFVKRELREKALV
ncbi:MAG: AI-2E family transporter [Thermoanaerobaculia bacterium]